MIDIDQICAADQKTQPKHAENTSSSELASQLHAIFKSLCCDQHVLQVHADVHVAEAEGTNNDTHCATQYGHQSHSPDTASDTNGHGAGYKREGSDVEHACKRMQTRTWHGDFIPAQVHACMPDAW